LGGAFEVEGVAERFDLADVLESAAVGDRCAGVQQFRLRPG